MNKWKTIWNSRTTEELIPHGSTEEVFLHLKSLMNVSSSTEIAFSSYKDQFEANLVKRSISCVGEPQSDFEVGCGSGMYLYYLGAQNKGFTLGGVDYSAPLIEAARMALSGSFASDSIKELYCAEATEIDPLKTYDCVYSRSVFQYFASEAYGLEAAEKMIAKANQCVGIFDLFDPTRRDDFLAYRRSLIENYDEKYADTPHLFYPKEMFLRLAEKHNYDVLFARDSSPGYWNEPFVYDVYLYKRH